MRNSIPDLTFRTAFIVGHPGETDRDFAELVDFVEWAEFERVGVSLGSSLRDLRALRPLRDPRLS